MKEREIDLIDLIADVLSHWRGILVVMLLGAVLLGAFSYMKSAQGVASAQQSVEVSPEEQLTQLEESLKETEQATVLTVIDDETEYIMQKNYAESSAIMQMDPFQVYRTDLIYKIQVEDMGQSCMLGTVYENLVNGIGMSSWIEEETGIFSFNADEVVFAERPTNLVVLNGAQETSLGNDSMKVVVFYSNEEDCKKLTGAVKKYVAEQQKSVEQDFGAHEVVLVSESTGVVMDTGIMDKQIANNNALVTLQTNIAKAKDAFTPGQKAYYDLLTAETDEESVEEPQTEEPAVQPTPSVSVKYVLLGAVLFAVLYAGIIFVMYILNSKVRTSDELQSLYHIPQIGLVVKDSKKKFFVDKWIQALRNHGKRQFTAEQSLDLATTAVKISAAKNELSSICLIGCDMKAGAEEVCKKLKAALEKEKLSVTILDNVLYDAEAMEKLEAVKGVVLVEKAGSTMYREIADELELVKRQGIKVLGGIVVE